MEYRLNKIDTDLRNTINEQTREGKIHSKQSVEVNSERLKDHKHRNKDHHKKEKNQPFSISKYTKGKSTIEISAYKSDSIEISVEKEEDKSKNSDRGLFIDIRR